MVEFPQIQAGKLFDFLQAVYQRIPMDKQLPGGFGHVQVVLKEFLDRKQCFLIQAFNRTLPAKTFRKEW